MFLADSSKIPNHSINMITPLDSRLQHYQKDICQPLQSHVTESLPQKSNKPFNEIELGSNGPPTAVKPADAMSALSLRWVIGQQKGIGQQSRTGRGSLLPSLSAHFQSRN